MDFVSYLDIYYAICAVGLQPILDIGSELMDRLSTSLRSDDFWLENKFSVHSKTLRYPRVNWKVSRSFF